MLSLSRSPADLLASFFTPHEPQGELLLLSGPSACGKTGWCLELAQQARASQVQVCGLVSPAVIQAGRKIAIDLLDLSSLERRRLARARLQESPTPGAAPHTGGWLFDPAVLDWGERLLDTCAPCRLLIIDELGPLEFLGDQGWQSGLRLVGGRQYSLACAVIRPSLLAEARRRWPWAQVLALPAAQVEAER